MARKTSRVRGLPGAVADKTRARIRAMHARGVSHGSIARTLGVPKSTVRYHALHDHVLATRAASRPQPRRRQTCSVCGDETHNAATCGGAA